MRRQQITWLSATLLPLVLVCWVHAQTSTSAPATPELTEDQMKEFLLHAKVIGSKHTSTGITSPWRLTLSDGKITHDALFQSIDDHKMTQQLADGSTAIHFVDSYHYNIAGYELSKLLGLSYMIPVTVERSWNQETGSLSWWVTVTMDERTRMARKLDPPNPTAWNKQMYNLRVLDQFIYDTDPNLTNFLIGEDWSLWRVDFSRAFRLGRDLQNEKDLTMCGRDLLAKLRSLDRNEVEARTKGHLTPGELTALMTRRDKLVAHFDQLIAQKGEDAVLF
jgi:hypothetical protein